MVLTLPKLKQRKTDERVTIYLNKQNFVQLKERAMHADSSVSAQIRSIIKTDLNKKETK